VDEHGWAVNGDKIWNNYSSSRNVDTESLMCCVFCLFVYKLVSLMFVLQWSGMNALVLVMEWVPCCIVDGLYGECESRLLVMVNVVVFGEWKNGEAREATKGRLQRGENINI
jgi:hypothetical protein